MTYESAPARIPAGTAAAGRYGGLAVPGQYVHAADGRLVCIDYDPEEIRPGISRTGTTEVNVILAVNQGLVKFKPGSD